MKPAAQIVVMVVFAFTFCEAQESVFRQIMNCRRAESFIPGTGCKDLEKAEECLNQIETNNNSDEMDLQRAKRHITVETFACPGLDTKVECIYSHTYDCMKKLERADRRGDNSACAEVVTAKECLIEFNSTCIRNVVHRQIEQLNKIEAKCSTNVYGDEQCGTEKIEECVHQASGCSSDDVDAANECLDTIREKCPEAKRLIQREKWILEYNCSNH